MEIDDEPQWYDEVDPADLLTTSEPAEIVLKVNRYDLCLIRNAVWTSESLLEIDDPHTAIDYSILGKKINDACLANGLKTFNKK